MGALYRIVQDMERGRGKSSGGVRPREGGRQGMHAACLPSGRTQSKKGEPQLSAFSSML